MVLIFAALLFLVFANYVPGTYLTLWDTIHSEFNFPLDIIRNLFSVWQEYRGLGLLDGQAHAADLPRQLLLWGASIFFPPNSLGYLNHFVALGIGSLGVYFLIKHVLLQHRTNVDRSIAATLGGLFYLLNFGTMQYFAVPFQAFSHFWASLPWLLYVLVRFLEKPDRRRLLYFILVHIVAASSFYVQTLFVVYLLSAGSIVLAHILLHHRLLTIKTAIWAFLLVFLINAFWLLPALYFFSTSAHIPGQAKINRMSSEDTFLQNKRRGAISDFLLLRGYYYDFVEDQEFTLEPWRDHFQKNTVAIAAYSLSGVVLLGLLRKNKYHPYFSLLFGFSATALLSDIEPFSTFQEILRTSWPLWDQVFRSPFTKFIVPAALSFAIFFALGVDLIIHIVRRYVYRYKQTVFTVVLGGLSVLLMYVSWPAFSGDLFVRSGRLTIPDQYFQLFDYFKLQNKSERVAVFPQESFWGWVRYRWEYRGSGIVWQGVQQPVLDRAFDVWSSANENYYWEASRAVYAQDIDDFEQLLKKYQVSWIVLDDTVRGLTSDSALYRDELRAMLESSEQTVLVKNLATIEVYRVLHSGDTEKFVAFVNNPPVVGPQYAWNDQDHAYSENGLYISSTDRAKVYYPFRSLFSGKMQNDHEFSVVEQNDSYVFRAGPPKHLIGGTLVLPQLTQTEITEVDPEGLRQTQKPPEVFWDGRAIDVNITTTSSRVSLADFDEGSLLEVAVPKIQGLYSIAQDAQSYRFDSCGLEPSQGSFRQKLLYHPDDTRVQIQSSNTNSCLSIPADNLTHKLGYLVGVTTRHGTGKSLVFNTVNNNSKRTDLETILPQTTNTARSYFVLPPMEKFGLGYTLGFKNTSIGAVETVNEIGDIAVNPIPYRFLTQLKIVAPSAQSVSAPMSRQPVSVVHPNPSLYMVETGARQDNSYLVLSQAFDAGWRAYRVKNQKSFLTAAFPFFFGEALEEHVLVNNWANGWKLIASADGQIIIVYWPQYLQYIGYLVLFLTLGYVVFLNISHTRRV